MKHDWYLFQLRKYFAFDLIYILRLISFRLLIKINERSKVKNFLIIRKRPNWVIIFSLRHFFSFYKEGICLKWKKNEKKNQHCVSFLQHASMLLKNINPQKESDENICAFWWKILGEMWEQKNYHGSYSAWAHASLILVEDSRYLL